MFDPLNRFKEKIISKFKRWIKKIIFTVKVMHKHDLISLAEFYHTDKWRTGKHWYASHYQRHFYPIRKMKMNILEIGVGGYDKTDDGGNSLRMWAAYFPKSNIYGLDIYLKKLKLGSRIKIFQGSQADELFLNQIANNIGKLDIIVDDGSHKNGDVIISFKTLFPFLNDGGIYVVEDLQTAYWPIFGGDSDNLNNPNTSMNFFKRLTDCLNHSEFIKPGYEPSYFDKNIASMHFYHNLVFVYKGTNNEGSFWIENNVPIKNLKL